VKSQLGEEKKVTKTRVYWNLVKPKGGSRKTRKVAGQKDTPGEKIPPRREKKGKEKTIGQKETGVKKCSPISPSRWFGGKRKGGGTMEATAVTSALGSLGDAVEARKQNLARARQAVSGSGSVGDGQPGLVGLGGEKTGGVKSPGAVVFGVKHLGQLGGGGNEGHVETNATDPSLGRSREDKMTLKKCIKHTRVTGWGGSRGGKGGKTWGMRVLLRGPTGEDRLDDAGRDLNTKK